MEFTMPISPNKILLPAINQFNQHYFNKIFWKIHYLQIIEELKQDLINQSRGAIAQRLFELRDIMGKYSLSPASYQAGIEELQEYVKQEPLLAARYLPFLSDCINQFQAALSKQPAFVLENFMADIFHALTQRHENKITLLERTRTLGFYKNLLVSTCYVDTLTLFANFYQADLLIASDNDSQALAALHEEFIKRLGDIFANAQTWLPPQISLVIAAQPHIPDAETPAPSNSYGKFTKALQQATSSLVQNPIAALTTALAYQIAATMGLSTTPFTNQNREQDRAIISSNPALTHYSPSASVAKEVLEQRFTQVAHELEQNKLTLIGQSSLELFNELSASALHITRLTNNNFLVLWKTIGQDGSTFNVAGKLFIGNGTLITAFQLPTQSDDPLPNCYAVELLNNNFMVAWSCASSTNPDEEVIQGQRFNAEGSTIDAPFQIQAVTGDSLTYPVLQALEEGDLVAVWQQDGGPQPNDPHHLWARMYNATAMPMGNAFAINPTSSANQLTPAVTNISGGGFFITWTVPGRTIAQPSRLYAQFFNQSGEALQNAFPVVPQGTDYQSQSACNQLGNDRILIAWQSSQQSNSNPQIYAQLIDNQGNILKAAFPVSNSTQNSQEAAAVIKLNSGNCLICWIITTPNTTTISLAARVVDSNGNTIGNEINIQAFDDNASALPSINSLSNGDLVLTWPVGNPTQDIATSILNTQLSATNLNQTLDYIEDQVCPFVPITIDAPVFIANVSVTMTLSDTNAGRIYSNATTHEVNCNTQNNDWQITGPVQEVNHALASLQFEPAPRFYNNCNVTVVIEDNFNRPLMSTIKLVGNQARPTISIMTASTVAISTTSSTSSSAGAIAATSTSTTTATTSTASTVSSIATTTTTTASTSTTAPSASIATTSIGSTTVNSITATSAATTSTTGTNPIPSNNLTLISALVSSLGAIVVTLAGWLGYRYYKKQRRATDRPLEGPSTGVEMEMLGNPTPTASSSKNLQLLPRYSPKNYQAISSINNDPEEVTSAKKPLLARIKSTLTSQNRNPYQTLPLHSIQKKKGLPDNEKERDDDPKHKSTAFTLK
jgi:hypothetical protein